MKFRSVITAILPVAVLLSSCGEKEPMAETICVGPDSLNAVCTMRSYTDAVSIVSNTSWTAKMDSGVARWVSLSKTAGTGNAVITVRALTNEYNRPRRGEILFVTPKGVKDTLTVIQAADPKGNEKIKASFRLGTYNLRLQVSDELEINKWANRKGRLFSSISDCAFDVFGVQEVSSTMQADLKTRFADTYGFFFFSPYYQGGTGDKAQGIIYRLSKFDISEKHFFWPGGGTDLQTMTQNDTGTSGNFKRGGCCCVLTHKETGIKIFFMNTHACLNSKPNEDLAPVYEQAEKKYNTSGYPSFFVGDLNARPSYPAITTYKTYWTDSYSALESKDRSGVENTYNGFDSPSGKYRLDYVFYRGSSVVLDKYCAPGGLYDGKYASDHFPVYIDLTIEL